MNVTAPKDQFSPCLTQAATSSDQSGNFLSTNVTVIDADQHMEDLQTSARGTQLCNRIIYPFKRTLSNAANNAILGATLGLVPATFILHGTVLASAVAGASVGLMLGGMAALAKRSSDYVNVGVDKGHAAGTLLGVAIAAPPALITTAAVAVGSFSVITPLLSTLQIPGAIYWAATLSNAEINNHEQEMKTSFQSLLSEFNKTTDMISKNVTGLTDSARADLTKPFSHSAYRYRY